MSFRPHRASPRNKSKPPRTAEALDIAARYFTYKLYVPGKAMTESWHLLSTLGEAAATIRRAVELGWVTLREVGQGRTRERYAALTDEGRQVARKGLR
jgi:hypothetical protein